MILTSIIVPKSEEIKGQLRTSDVDYFEGLIKKKINDTIKGLTIYADDKKKIMSL